jgi:hypothetical protein
MKPPLDVLWLQRQHIIEFDRRNIVLSGSGP